MSSTHTYTHTHTLVHTHTHACACACACASFLSTCAWAGASSALGDDAARVNSWRAKPAVGSTGTVLGLDFACRLRRRGQGPWAWRHTSRPC
eukprot:15474348-Alexandrium_andersonii.AAC.1